MTAEQLQAQWGELFGALSDAFAAGDHDASIETLERLGETREKTLYRDLRALFDLHVMTGSAAPVGDLRRLQVV